jgi:hypothetical protein
MNMLTPVVLFITPLLLLCTRIRSGLSPSCVENINLRKIRQKISLKLQEMETLKISRNSLTIKAL